MRLGYSLLSPSGSFGSHAPFQPSLTVWLARCLQGEAARRERVLDAEYAVRVSGVESSIKILSQRLQLLSSSLLLSVQRHKAERLSLAEMQERLLLGRDGFEALAEAGSALRSDASEWRLTFLRKTVECQEVRLNLQSLMAAIDQNKISMEVVRSNRCVVYL